VILDFFRGEEADKINLAGLEHVISCSVGGEADEVALASAIPSQPIADVTAQVSAPMSGSNLPLIHFRTYAIKLLASGSRTPLVNLESVGPDFDFRIRRTQQADGDVWKTATKKPKKAAAPGQVAGKKRKDRNIDIDEMGDKVGRLHVGKQDLSKLQTRKMKGLKKGKDALGEAGDDAEDGVLDEEVAQPGKKPRT
jgi:ribosome production factor 2